MNLDLGHLVTREGVLPDRSNIKAILDCPAPKTRTQVRSFVGMVQYYGDYVELLAELAAPPVRAIQEGCALPLGTYTGRHFFWKWTTEH